MSMNEPRPLPQTAWFVGASGEDGDYTARFVAEGIWENGYTDRHLDLVRSMHPGERIAIKSAYTRKHELPFDNHGQSVSVMAIKAIGTIAENMNDGRRVRVNWTLLGPPREWYFSTHRGTIWRVQPDDWMSQELIAFAFESRPQSIDKFRNAPFWKERFGDPTPGAQRFAWTRFYQALADRLLLYQRDRRPLLKGLRGIAERVDLLEHLSKDEFAEGATGFLRDICPFTVLGLFNRNILDVNRRTIARELAGFLGVEEPVPETFEAIPLLNNMGSWLFPKELRRAPDHIDSLWKVFAAALEFADTESDETRAAFAAAFDAANGRERVGWTLTFGLFWSRPWSFVSLDAHSQHYIARKLGLQIGLNGPKGRCNSSDYLALIDVLSAHFKETSYPIHSFPELSLEAWRYRDPTEQPATLDDDAEESADTADATDALAKAAEEPLPTQPFSVSDVIDEGCFLGREEIERLLGRLKTKKNLILQGPPGTGKTWLARRLGFALVGAKDDRSVRAVQFHPNLSYEDFVRGWRPVGEGKLVLADGVFMEAIHAALAAPNSKFVLVIEEINRGNPAQIFGELLTLIEASKRGPKEALELSYRKHPGERVHVPENLYVIGTMNVADRSLALVDLALRRRFAFADLQPQLGAAWKAWITGKCGVDAALVGDIEQRMNDLNGVIAADSRLGPQFRVGHSYVTPTEPIEAAATRDWFVQVVETEIGPLLDEYWFDAPAKAKEVREQLVKGWR